MFELLKKEGKARRGRMTTVHGVIETPVFMNVGTSAAIKGGVSTDDLREINCQVELSNTYHLHIRPGDDLIYEMGGLHKFFNWDKPILTDSGGFQVFSLAKLRKITEEGVYFNSHMDGKRIFMGPEESMRIQSNIASTIAMAFDECVENPAAYEYAKASSERTLRWLKRSKDEMDRLNSLPTTINKNQMLFGINQGSTYDDLRIENMCRTAEFDLDGYAIGGLAVGEEAEVMYRIIEAVEPHMPENKPRYLMGKLQDVVTLALGSLDKAILALYVVGVEHNGKAILIGLHILNLRGVLLGGVVLALDALPQHKRRSLLSKLLVGEHTILYKYFQVVPLLIVLLTHSAEKLFETRCYLTCDISRNLLDVGVALQVATRYVKRYVGRVDDAVQ